MRCLFPGDLVIVCVHGLGLGLFKATPKSIVCGRIRVFLYYPHSIFTLVLFLFTTLSFLI
jgi:hypothetical protein